MQNLITKHYRVISTLLILAIAGLSFYVGMLQGSQVAGKSVALNCSPNVLSKLNIPTQALAEDIKNSPESAPTSLNESQGTFAGSKNGTKYYAPGCAGLERIKPENRVWFQTAEDATLQGYTAASC